MHVYKSFLFFILDCSNETSLGVFVENEGVLSYKAKGVFACPNNQVLFHTNGTLPITSNTFCQYSAKWNDEINYECWRG